MGELQAKEALDKIIKKSRVHLYKPIQIAEILYQKRVNGPINLLNLESYRNISKKWRDDITIQLVGRKSTSSARYQDDVFNESAMPPKLLDVLGKENNKNNGVVEAYIYSHFSMKLSEISKVIDYVRTTPVSEFDLIHLFQCFRENQVLRRSIDKIYEIVVYSLFDTLITKMEAKITLSVACNKKYLIEEFEDFAKLVLGVDKNNLEYITDASINRIGVTNAADRGLDMWANSGPAIQVKHLTLDLSLAREITGNIASDKIIIVCRDYESDVIKSIISQLGLNIQGIIKESQLDSWYRRALHGKYAGEIAQLLIDSIIEQLLEEFPSQSRNTFAELFTSRGYDKIKLNGIWEKRNFKQN